MEYKTFIASSSENIHVAEVLRELLIKDQENIVVSTWKHPEVFEKNRSPFEGLQEKLNEFDYSIFLFFSDDTIERRNTTLKVVRDNVLFEAGLFFGRHSSKHCFIVRPEGENSPTLPTDLLGITTEICPEVQNLPSKTLIASKLGEVAKKIKGAILASAQTRGVDIVDSITSLTEKLDSLNATLPSSSIKELLKIIEKFDVQGIEAAGHLSNHKQVLEDESFYHVLTECGQLFKKNGKSDEETLRLFSIDTRNFFESLKIALLYRKKVLDLFKPSLVSKVYAPAYFALLDGMEFQIKNLGDQHLPAPYFQLILDRLPTKEEVLAQVYQ